MNCPPRSKIEEEVLKEVRPGKLQEYLLLMLYKRLHSVLEDCLTWNELKAEVKPVGSFAKDTYTRDKWELDVFVLFEDVDDSWILQYSEEFLRSCLSRYFPTVIKYAQHPYVTVTLLGMEADVVPALKLDSPRKKGLGVERTPFHTEYVMSKLDACRRDDVRLLKAFFKGIGVYGAETRVRGFSGYLTELLIIHYGSFEKLIREASRWVPPVYIDIEGIGDREFLEKKYKDSPMIVVDPVDPERNAAAAVSLKSLSTFVLASRLYLRRPSREFFYPFTGETIVKPYGFLVTVECIGDYVDSPPESVWGKAKRGARDLFDTTKQYGFQPLYYTIDTDESKYVRIELVTLENELPRVEVAKGPHAWDSLEGVMAFLEKRLKDDYPVWIGEDGRIYGLRARKFRSLAEIVTQWISGRAISILGAHQCKSQIGRCSSDYRTCTSIPRWLTID